MNLEINPFCFSGKFKGIKRTTKPSRALRSRMRTPKKLSVSKWAQKYRIVTGIDKQPGAWDSDILPHLNKIMDTISAPYVREVYMCLPERAGKTQVMLNAMGWTIDQGSKSGNIFWLMPTESEAKKAMGERIIPVLKAKKPDGSPGKLAGYLSEYDDDTKMGTVRFKTGTRLFPAWSNSPASMASYFGKLNIADEIDKFAIATNEGTTALDLIRKRARDDKTRSKFIAASTPGRARKIYNMVMNEADQTWEYRLKCPDCGEHVIQNGEHLTDESGQVLVACHACGSLWGEIKRDQAYRSGGWVCTRGQDKKRPKTVGYHMTAFCLPMVQLAEIAQYWQRSQTGTFADKTAWSNGYMVEDYEQVRVADDYKNILKLCDDRPRDVVPTDAACLVLNVDTQQNGFYYEVAAIGYGDSLTAPKTWLVSKGFLLNFSDLVLLAGRVWQDSNGRKLNIVSALIDSGGTRKKGTPEKHSRTKEVYEFCKNNPLFKPVKGTGRRSAPVAYTTIDRWPGTSKPIPGGLILTTLDVHYYKDELARRLAVNQDDPGAFILYSGFTAHQLESKIQVTEDDNDLIDYAKHLCAEYKDEVGNWVHDRKSGRNDYHDCATYRIYHIDLVMQLGLLVQNNIKPKQKIQHQRERHQGQRTQRISESRW